MKTTITFLALLLATSPALAQDVHIGVLTLFHPREFALSASAGSALVLRAGEESLILEGSSGVNLAHIHFRGGQVVVEVGSRLLRTSRCTVSSRDNGSVDFTLSVPGKITRHYRGTLEVKTGPQVLTAVVTMDLETAVASVMAAESTVDTPSETLKALAVAARSYLVAGKGRHREFDFCDTTHCQFLREPPASNTSAAQAANSTRGLVIAFQSQPFAAMYTRSCSGRTFTPSELGLPPAAYPYYSVDCKYCREHPARWQSRVSANDAATLKSSNEFARLEVDRHLGWGAVPSNTFVVRREGEQAVLRGIGQGHGMGLCQAGAQAMAKEGADFRQILAHYYPNTVIVTLRSPGLLR
jgi:peptidoglycan hydrolase-like amidase